MAAADRSADEHLTDSAEVVAVEVADEDLVQVGRGNLERPQPLDRALTHVEDELVPVAELDEEAGRRLRGPRRWHPGATSDNAHLVGSQVLAVRNVVVAISRLGRRHLLRIRQAVTGRGAADQVADGQDNDHGNDHCRYASIRHALPPPGCDAEVGDDTNPYVG